MTQGSPHQFAKKKSAARTSMQTPSYRVFARTLPILCTNKYVCETRSPQLPNVAFGTDHEVHREQNIRICFETLSNCRNKFKRIRSARSATTQLADTRKRVHNFNAVLHDAAANSLLRHPRTKYAKLRKITRSRGDANQERTQRRRSLTGIWCVGHNAIKSK